MSPRGVLGWLAGWVALALWIMYEKWHHFGWAGFATEMRLAGLLLAIPFIIALVIISSGKKHIASDAAAAANADLVAQASHDELTPIAVANVVHESDEKFYWEQAAELWEVETHSEFVGGYSGVSVRIARGVYARTGGGRGHRVSKESLDPIDRGEIYLSDKRLLFSGSRGVVEIPYKKIGAILPFKDGARIDRINAKPMTFVTHDARLPIILGRAINKQFAAVSDAPPAAPSTEGGP